MWRSWSSSVRSSIKAATSGGGPLTTHGCTSSVDGSLFSVFFKCHLQEWDCYDVLGASCRTFAGKNVLKRGNCQSVFAKGYFRAVLLQRLAVLYSRHDEQKIHEERSLAVLEAVHVIVAWQSHFDEPAIHALRERGEFPVVFIGLLQHEIDVKRRNRRAVDDSRRAANHDRVYLQYGKPPGEFVEVGSCIHLSCPKGARLVFSWGRSAHVSGNSHRT